MRVFWPTVLNSISIFSPVIGDPVMPIMNGFQNLYSRKSVNTFQTFSEFDLISIFVVISFKSQMSPFAAILFLIVPSGYTDRLLGLEDRSLSANIWTHFAPSCSINDSKMLALTASKSIFCRR